MLAPRDRKTLLSALRPPEGFRVDAAIATTFSLDLTALLTAPLAFSLLDLMVDAEPTDKVPDRELDPYALLRAAREHARRMLVFCDATRIVVPHKYRALFVHLEKCVAEVCAPADERVFHPKLWLLRFTDAEQNVRYRFLCASRNLTFDQSWDTLLVLDGELTERSNAFASNRPLSEFVEALPKLMRPGVALSRDRTRLVARVADELLRVRFELPEGVDKLAFHPLGIAGYGKFKWPERIQRALVVSPFVDSEGLKPWTDTGRDHAIVSRVDQLDAVDTDSYSRLGSCYVLAEALDRDEGDSDAPEPSSDEVPTGLHAKLYVVDDGWDAHVWTGSANATRAAFSGNVEMLVQMSGKKSLLGVQRFLDAGLSEMTQPYARSAVPVSAVERALESRLLKVRRQLAESRWLAKVGENSPEGYAFTLSCEAAPACLSESVRVRPITLSAQHAQRVSGTQTLFEFGPCSLELITSFFAFSVVVEVDGEQREVEFVLTARLEGVPADRDEQLLAGMFKEPGRFLQFLSMLLAEDPAEWLAESMQRATTERASAAGGAFDGALLERLVRTLHTSPSHLDSVNDVIRDLSRTEAGRAAIDGRFQDLWKPIWAARQALGEKAR